MSVRAYRRVKEPVLADTPSFNLWHDNELFEHLQSLPSSWVSSTEDSITQIELSREELQDFVKAKDSDIPDEVYQALQADLDATKDQEYIFYECY